MSALADWLREQHERFQPFFSPSDGQAVRRHVLGLLVMHGATCGENFKGAPCFLDALAGMYRLNRNSPFSLPVEGWAKIRRVEQVGLVDQLHVDVCADLPEPVEPVSEAVVIESIRALLQVAPEVDSLTASEAISSWLGQETVTPQIVLDTEHLDGVQLTCDQGDHGVSALSAFSAIERAYRAYSHSLRAEVCASSSVQLSFEERSAVPSLPADIPNRILSGHLRVIEDTDEGEYLARVRLYLACFEWYRVKNMHPRPMESVCAAVQRRDSVRSAVGA